MNDEIIDLIMSISDAGYIKFESRVVCKMSPHSQPEIITSISVDDDFDKMSNSLKQTIIQRLKLIKHESSKH